MSIYLIDVSSHQGEIDGKQIKAAGYSGIIVKLTEGTDYHNPYLDHQIQQARDNGLLVGFYHYARQDLTDNFKAEADWFLLWALPRLQPGDVLALDFEQADDRGDLSAWALGWLRYVQSKTGQRVFLYTYPWYAIAHLPSPDLANFPLWYASYPDGVNSPADLGGRAAPQAPAPWDKIVIWQFTGGSPVAGTTFPTDLNRFDGTVADLKAYGKSANLTTEVIVTEAKDATGQARAYINDKGETILEINFGGYATGIEGFMVVDAGVSVRNGQDVYDRTLRQPDGFLPWTKRG